MKNKKPTIIISILAVIVVVVNLLFFAKDMFLYNTKGSESMEDLPKGKFMYSSICSYNENLVVKTYVIKIGGLGKAVRAEIIDNNTKATRTIYWESGTTNINVSWNSEKTVVINGKKINVNTGFYDARGKK